MCLLLMMCMSVLLHDVSVRLGFHVSRLFGFFFKQKTAYEMRISDWSSDVCSSDLFPRRSPLHLRSPCRQSHGSSGWGGKPIAPAGGSHQSLLSGVHPPFPGAPAVADRHTTGLHRTCPACCRPSGPTAGSR